MMGKEGAKCVLPGLLIDATGVLSVDVVIGVVVVVENCSVIVPVLFVAVIVVVFMTGVVVLTVKLQGIGEGKHNPIVWS